MTPTKKEVAERTKFWDSENYSENLSESEGERTMDVGMGEEIALTFYNTLPFLKPRAIIGNPRVHPPPPSMGLR